MRRISSTGTAAAPVTASRSDDMSNSASARVVEDRLVDGRRPGQHRDLLLGDALHHRVDVEHRVRDDRRALQDAREDAGLEPEGVEERVDDEVAVAVAQADDVGPRVVRADARAVGQHRALGLPGRARGEEDVGEVVAGRARAPRASTLGADRRSARARNSSQVTVPAAGVPRSTTISLQRRGRSAAAQQRRRSRGEEVGDGEEQLHVGAVEHVRAPRRP